MVVGYLRVSTEKQHLSNQQDEILRFAQTRNMEIDRWVTEVVSGKKDQKDRKLGSSAAFEKRRYVDRYRNFAVEQNAYGNYDDHGTLFG